MWAEQGKMTLTISRIPCARLTPSSSIYEGRQRVKMEAGGSFTKNRRGRLCHRSVETHTWDGSWWPSELRATMATAAPAPLFTLAVTVLCGFLVPSWIHISPRKRRRWLSAIIHLAPSPHPGPQLPLLVVQTKLSPWEIWGPLTYPPGPLISTQPLELCHPQYGS